MFGEHSSRVRVVRAAVKRPLWRRLEPRPEGLPSASRERYCPLLTPEQSERCPDTGRLEEKKPTLHMTQARPVGATGFRNGLIQPTATI
jgi:hypothetical protein